MKAFASIPDFLVHLGAAVAEMHVAEHHALEAAARLVEAEAKAELGSYQDAAGPFPAWAPLAESTQAQRARDGYTADEPLLRSSTMQAAIDHAVDGREAVVGVKDDGATEPGRSAAVGDVAIDMEFGTARAPPRPFLGPAGFRKGPEVASIIGRTVFSTVVAGSAIDRAIP